MPGMVPTGHRIGLSAQFDVSVNDRTAQAHVSIERKHKPRIHLVAALQIDERPDVQHTDAPCATWPVRTLTSCRRLFRLVLEGDTVELDMPPAIRTAWFRFLTVRAGVVDAEERHSARMQLIAFYLVWEWSISECGTDIGKPSGEGLANASEWSRWKLYMLVASRSGAWYIVFLSCICLNDERRCAVCRLSFIARLWLVCQCTQIDTKRSEMCGAATSV